MKIVRVLNNNVVLATRDDGEEVVLTGGRGVRHESRAARRHQPPLPHAEATAITLHVVNAAFHTDDLSDTYTMTGLFSQLFNIVDSSLGITMDRTSVNAARFITHMRYFFVRVRNGNQLNEGMSLLRESLEQSHPDAVLCADRLASVLELRLDTELTDDERAYLALHVARLSAEIGPINP